MLFAQARGTLQPSEALVFGVRLSGAARVSILMMEQPRGGRRRPVAYKNLEFLESPDGRSIRILSEYLHPLSHFREEKIQDTIVFFGSARIGEEGPLSRYYQDARELARRVTTWFRSRSR